MNGIAYSLYFKILALAFIEIFNVIFCNRNHIFLKYMSSYLRMTRVPVNVGLRVFQDVGLQGLKIGNVCNKPDGWYPYLLWSHCLVNREITGIQLEV